MLKARDEILETVRKNQPARRPLPDVSAFHSEARPLAAAFEEALKKMAGEVIARPPADFDSFLRERFPDARNFCSAVPEFRGNQRPEDFSDWADAAAIDVMVVRAPWGVAETGSVLLTEKELRVNTVAFLAHDIVILLDPRNIVENIHDAYRQPEFLHTNYAVLVTGPSGTGDIGGVTVHPAQGVTTLTVILWPEN